MPVIACFFIPINICRNLDRLSQCSSVPSLWSTSLVRHTFIIIGMVWWCIGTHWWTWTDEVLVTVDVVNTWYGRQEFRWRIHKVCGESSHLTCIRTLPWRACDFSQCMGGHLQCRDNMAVSRNAFHHADRNKEYVLKFASTNILFFWFVSNPWYLYKENI